MKNAAILFLFILSAHACFSQKQIVKVGQIWIGNSSQVRFSQRWGASIDFQVRSREKLFEGISQVSSRMGVVYYPSESVRVSGGYYFANNIPRDYTKVIWQMEHSGWQQVAWSNKYPRLNINQSARLEQRFRHRVKNEFELGQGYGFNFRTRYNIFLSLALSRNAFAPHTWAAAVYNEVYLNFGKQIVYNTFDQYRLFGGFNYTFNKQSSLLFGYVYNFQQLTSGRTYRILQAARIFYLFNLDLHNRNSAGHKAIHDVSFKPTSSIDSFSD